MTGLHKKFRVTKDGEPQDGCFVLKPEQDMDARAALRTYAAVTDNEELADDLLEWLTDLPAEGEYDQPLECGRCGRSDDFVPSPLITGDRHEHICSDCMEALEYLLNIALVRAMSEGE